MDYADWSALGHMISPEAGSWAQSHPNHTDKDWRWFAPQNDKDTFPEEFE